MSYDNAGSVQREEYGYTDATFGATTVAHNMIGPKGCVGFVRDIIIDVLTALVGTTTVPEIDIGTASGDFTYGRYRLGTTAILGYGTGIHRAGQEAITGNPPRVLNDFTGHVVLDGGPYGTTGSVFGGSSTTTYPLGRIPKDTAFVISAVAGVGGTPAGGGQYRVIVDWLGLPGM
jgi:hypothetical protein